MNLLISCCLLTATTAIKLNQKLNNFSTGKKQADQTIYFSDAPEETANVMPGLVGRMLNPCDSIGLCMPAPRDDTFNISSWHSVFDLKENIRQFPWAARRYILFAHKFISAVEKLYGTAPSIEMCQMVVAVAKSNVEQTGYFIFNGTKLNPVVDSAKLTSVLLNMFQNRHTLTQPPMYRMKSSGGLETTFEWDFGGGWSGWETTRYNTNYLSTVFYIRELESIIPQQGWPKLFDNPMTCEKFVAERNSKEGQGSHGSFAQVTEVKAMAHNSMLNRMSDASISELHSVGLSSEELGSFNEILEGLENDGRMTLHDIEDAVRKGVSFLKSRTSNLALQEKAQNSDVNIYIDGYTPVPLRQEKLSGFVNEWILSADIEEGGITVNNTHAFIPFDRMIQFDFYRRMHDLDDYEIGVTNQMFTPNPLAIFDEDISVGLAAKTMVYKRGKPLATPAERAQPPFQKETAKQMRFAKRFVTNLFAIMNRIGAQLKSSGMNPAHTVKIKQFAESSDQSDGVGEHVQAMHALWKNITRRPENTHAVHSFIECMHWNKQHVTLVDNGVWFPLNTKMVSYRSITVSAPFEQVEIQQGVSEISVVDGQLLIYLGVSQTATMTDYVTGAYKSGPPDGIGELWPSVTEDLRKNSYEPKLKLLHLFLYGLMMTMPQDYDYLWEDPAKLCPQEKYDKYDEHFKNNGYEEFVKGNSESQQQVVQVATDMTMTNDCAVTLMKPTTHVNGVGYSYWDAMAYLHAILEPPNKHVVPLMFNRTWNNVDTERSRVVQKVQ